MPLGAKSRCPSHGLTAGPNPLFYLYRAGRRPATKALVLYAGAGQNTGVYGNRGGGPPGGGAGPARLLRGAVRTGHLRITAFGVRSARYRPQCFSTSSGFALPFQFSSKASKKNDGTCSRRTHSPNARW